MTTTTRTETVALGDGTLGAHVTVPASGCGPGLVLVHEILGVTDYVLDVAGRLADLGYVVACPDLYWRIAAGTALPHDEDGFAAAMALVMQLDLERAVADCVVTLAHLRSLPEVREAAGAGGRAGAGLAGFCFGGSLAFLAAAECRPDVVVSYYGSSVPEHVDLLERISCPVLLHFGGSDPFIPREQVAAVEKAAATVGRDDVEVHVHEQAGHAFDNDRAAGFHEPSAAAAAWGQTVGFLARYLPVTPPA